MTAAKQVRAQYTQEFKMEAVRQVREGQTISVVAKVLGIPKASLGNWVRQAAKGALSGAAGEDKAVRVSPEQMEIALTLCLRLSTRLVESTRVSWTPVSRWELRRSNSTGDVLPAVPRRCLGL